VRGLVSLGPAATLPIFDWLQSGVIQQRQILAELPQQTLSAQKIWGTHPCAHKGNRSLCHEGAYLLRSGLTGFIQHREPAGSPTMGLSR